MNYFKNKTQLSQEAVKHTRYEEVIHKDQIQYSIDNSRIYDDTTKFSWPTYNNSPQFILVQSDTVQAIEKITKLGNGKHCALNFASYKHPGGMFINGSSAQEESLCHKSFLYNVISSDKFADYYDWNKKNLNNGLYTNRAIYSPDIHFTDGISDILTCAAPNLHVARYMRHLPEDIIENAWISRVRFIDNIIHEESIHTIILGAWGCGVFKNDPVKIANYFKNFLTGNYKVILAIPDDKTYNAFASVFN